MIRPVAFRMNEQTAVNNYYQKVLDGLLPSTVNAKAQQEFDAFVAKLRPIGGLKEKMLAALRGGIKTVIIPEENVKDLADIPDNVKQGLEIVPVKWIDKVLSIALERQPVPLTDEEVAAQMAAASARPAAGSADATKH